MGARFQQIGSSSDYGPQTHGPMPMGPNIGPKPGPRAKVRACAHGTQCIRSGRGAARILAMGPGLGPIFGPMGPFYLVLLHIGL